MSRVPARPGMEWAGVRVSIEGRRGPSSVARVLGGFDTLDANVKLGHPADSRDYGVGAAILADLGVRAMRLLTNNPAKRAGLEGYGLKIVGRVPLPSHVTAENLAYLRRMALSMLKAVEGPKCGVRNRRLSAGWDTAFLEEILLHACGD